MIRQILAAALLFGLAAADVASAQVVRPWYWGPGVHVNPWGVAPGWPYGYGYGYGPTSAYGDALRGQADVLRGLGQYNRATTEAMINYEQARAQYIENRKRWLETY